MDLKESYLGIQNPIYRLPDELLVIIFDLIVQDDQLSYGVVNSNPVFTQVCRHWRTVSLDTSSLWRRICLAHPIAWINEVFRRSQSQPLILWHNYDPDPENGDGAIDDIPAIALSEPWRIEELSLCTSSANFRSCVALSQPLLLARSITLANESLDPDAFTLPDDIFGGHTPRLRELTLFNCIPPWKSPCWTGLTSLYLVLPCTSPPKMHLSRIMECLQVMPMLQTLELWEEYAYDSPGDDLSAWDEKTNILMPHLSKITIRADWECFRMLNFISGPKISNVTLTLLESFSADNFAMCGVTRIASIVANAFSSLHTLDFDWDGFTESFRITLKGDSDIEFKCSLHAVDYFHVSQGA
ncbi:hypothetical protein HGRIS_011737 [Hohenbuehelia grisea]|uniref:F-box domain-containing protein n=1 Tax=Hohenbuehelia grisea TaxID=104357 RepID=A0ABR3JW14_9AGAR